MHITMNSFDWISWEFWVVSIIFSIVAYLIGTFNFARILSWLTQDDLEKSGSGNYGATNVGRLYGARGFGFVMFGDMIRVIILGGIFEAIRIGFHLNINVALPLAFVIIGNNFPCWWWGKGGKGVSTMFGFLLYVSWPIALISAAFFALVLLVIKRVSLSSLIGIIFGSVFLTIQILYFGGYDTGLVFQSTYVLPTIIGTWIATLAVVYKHKGNLKRFFITRNEPSVPWVKKLNSELSYKTTNTFKKCFGSKSKSKDLNTDKLLRELTKDEKQRKKEILHK